MKYLIIGKDDNGNLEWNACDSPAQTATFIKVHYKDVLEKCNYDWKFIHQQIFVIAVTDYIFAGIDVTPPQPIAVSVFLRELKEKNE